MAGIAVATTTQYVFKRDFNSQKWQPVGQTGKMCKVQFIKKGGDCYFKLKQEGGGTFEYNVSQQKNKIHFSQGFVQVPIGESKELYGIKFKESADGEIFYGKIVNAMGQEWHDLPTTVGADNLPTPVSNFNRPPETFAGVSNTGTGAGGQILRVAAAPMTLASSRAPPPRRVTIPPGNMDNFNPQAGGVVRGHAPNVPQHQPQNQQMYPNQGGGFMGGAIPGGVNDNRYYPSKQQSQQRYVGMNQEPPPPPRRAGASGMEQPGIQPNLHGYQPPNQGFPGQPNINQQNQGFQPQPNKFGQQNRYGGRSEYDGGVGLQQNPPVQQKQQNQGGVAGWPGMGPGAPQHQPPHVAQPPPTQRKQPPPAQPTDLPTVAKSLMSAINRRDKEGAQFMMEHLLNAEKGGVFSADYDLKKEPPKEEKKFVLAVKVEFQQPRKNPIPLFLDVYAGKSIAELQFEVEQKFFIPRASQNWIIGDKLIKNNDELKQTLQDLEVTPQYVNEVTVYMYVMHTKKVNIPKDDSDSIRQQRQLQQQRQQNQQRQQQNIPPQQHQQNLQPQQQVQFQGDAGMGQTGSYPVPGTGQTGYGPQGQPENVYNTLDNRGYQGKVGGYGNLPPTHAQGGYQQENTYGQLNMQQVGQPANLLVTRASAPQNEAPPVPVRDNWLDTSQNINRGAPAGQMDVRDYHNPNELQPLPEPAAQPRPKPAKVVEKPKVGWTCPDCTLVNIPHRPGCELCGHERPVDYVVPADTPLDDATRKAQENDRLFQEYAVHEKERKKQEAQARYQKLIEAEDAVMVTNEEKFDCIICYLDVEPGNGIILRECLHQFCKDCLHDTVVNSQEAEIKCPFDDGDYNCQAPVSEREIRAVVNEEELMALHKRGLRQAEGAAANSFHCKTTDCESFCFYEDEVNEFNCPVCKKKNCLLCKAIHEGMDCQEYQDDLKRRAANDEAARATQQMLEQLVKDGDAMYCPKCNIIVQKKDGCDWIRCIMCKTEICWATKGPRWGPKGRDDTSGGCKCRVGGKKCHPLCRNCH